MRDLKNIYTNEKGLAHLLPILVLGVLAISLVLAVSNIGSQKNLQSQAAEIETGAYIGAFGGPGLNGVKQLESDTGKKMAIAQTYFIGWSNEIQWWLVNTLNETNAHGAMPMISINPAPDGQLPESFDQRYSLSAFANGEQDTQARLWAQELKRYGKPVLVRFAHEFNHDGFSWDIRKNGQTPAQYIAAWRHLHDVFTQEGATNVLWVWCPYINWDGVHTFEEAFPGDAYVDWVALDAYNFAGVDWPDPKEWSFTELIKPSYERLRAISKRPVMIAEVGTNEAGDDGTKKANWLTSAFTNELQTMPGIKAVLYFNHDTTQSQGCCNWPVQSTAKAKQAFTTAVANPYYISTWQGTPGLNENRLTNASFESGLTPWGVNQVVGTSVTHDTTNAASGTASVKATISQLPTNAWDVQLYQRDFPITAGRQTTITFWAKASENRAIDYGIFDADSPYTWYGGGPAQITTSWQQFTYTFTPTISDNSALITFNFGNALGTVWIDTVSVQQGAVSSPAPTITTSPTSTPTPTPTSQPTSTPTPPPAGDTQVPTVTITSPANNATERRNKNVTIQATATDNVRVTKVEFYVDGQLKCTDTTASYSCTYRTPFFSGTDQLQAKAYDAAGNVGTSAIVTISIR